jgi:hypothetical protein
MSDETEDLRRLVAFVSSLDERGAVYAALKPVVEKLRMESRFEEKKTSDLKEGDVRSNEGAKKPSLLFVALHKSMLAHGFICVIEAASTVPGFAAPIRGKPPSNTITIEYRA